METNNTIKEYYVKIFDLYTNCVNMLTALNQSLSSSSPQIVVDMVNNDGDHSTVSIPSFLYLENKLDTIENSLTNLINIPKSGDAWFENKSNMYKFHLVKSNSAPQKPNIDDKDIVASYTDNNYFKDLVTPKLYLKMNIKNLTNNIEKMFVRKYTLSASLFNIVSNSGVKTNDELLAILYTYVRGNDYDYYDSVIDLPIRKETYNSQFNIMDIPTLMSGNPWSEVNDNNKENLNYKITLDTIEYKHQEDSSIRFKIKIGDYLSLNNTNNIYLVKSVNSSTNEIIIEEYIGHANIQTFAENQNMFFTIYENDFSEYNYLQIPLEEDQYIVIFVGTIYNNVRSILSDAQFINLNNINMTDEFGNLLYDSSGNKIDYISYYNEYAKNIGDILYGLSSISNPLLQEYSFNTIELLQTSDVIQDLVSLTIDPSNIRVIPINKHIIDDKSTQEIINLHNQKGELNNKLSSINANIDTLYNTLTNTDWSQEISISQISVQKKLEEYYTERTQITIQLNDVVDQLNARSVLKHTEDLKFRIRGILSTDQLEEYFATINLPSEVKIIGIDLQYKYKSLYTDTTSLSSINDITFTNWNKYISQDKERITTLNESKSKMNITWEEQNVSDNIIKWNQIDIPINEDEDVIIKVRFKYNVGQPFINLYTPWSNEMTFEFPEEYKELKQIADILAQNRDDLSVASFNKTLINDGYAEHINNKVIANNQIFFHMPENIYSGFNTSENNLLSLKDKLTSMSNDIDKYRDLIEQSINAKYSVYLEFDNETLELFSGSINRININDSNIADSFVKKNMRIIIKNTGKYPVKLYSQFPGNSDIALLEDNRDAYNRTIGNYERVPMLINETMAPQHLGQWIYFRQNNPYTKQDIYLNEENQKIQDKSNSNASLIWDQNYNNYIRNDNNQILYPYKEHGVSSSAVYNKNIWNGLEFNPISKEFRIYNVSTSITNDGTYSYDNKNMSNFYYYSNVDPGSNVYLMRFEDICYVEKTGNVIFLTEADNISEFNKQGKEYLNNTMIDYNGAFLYPNIMHKNNIIIDNTDVVPTNYVIIEPGKELTVPVVFEYCLGNLTNNITDPITSIKKSLYFDLKDSLYLDPKNYMIEVSVNSDYSSLNNYLDKLRVATAENNE